MANQWEQPLSQKARELGTTWENSSWDQTEVSITDFHPVRKFGQWKTGMTSWFPNWAFIRLISELHGIRIPLWKSAVRELSLKSCRPWGYTQHCPGTCSKRIILGGQGKGVIFFPWQNREQLCHCKGSIPQLSRRQQQPEGRTVPRGPGVVPRRACLANSWRWRDFLSSPLRTLGIIAGTEILYKQLVAELCKTGIIKY